MVTFYLVSERSLETRGIMRKAFVLAFILTFSLAFHAQNPEPSGWYAGDMHVHRSCGGPPVSISSVHDKMINQNLASLSLLADMGNGEVQDPATDLPRVNGNDDPATISGRIIHWDAEWHWDATYAQYQHQALGGHIVALGLKEAHQIWSESTFPILDWAHQQNGIAGFAHMQYLDSGFPQTLSCCTPYEYPVEVALGTADFISEDVNGSDITLDAYYRLLNSGFRPGFAAGTDFPCNDGSTIGSPLTYVRVVGGEMTYRNWIEGISNGRTVVSRNGHDEFLDLKVNGSAGPGDEIFLAGGSSVQASVQWTATQNLSGTIELVANGVVVAHMQASVAPGTPATLNSSVNFTRSGWLAARRMGPDGHVVHTGAIFITVDHAPVRANADDPQFYVDWIDNLSSNISPGGPWNYFFPSTQAAVQTRYQAARSLYQQIAAEAQGTSSTLSSVALSPVDQTIGMGSTQQFTATGSYSNGASLNITGQVVWSSSNPGAATINLRGLAASVAPGTTIITATQSGVSQSSLLTVEMPQPPVISNIQVTNITSNGATFSWSTTTPSDSQVLYGATDAYGSASALNSTLVAEHSVTVTGLSPSSTYHFSAKSQDAFGNLANSVDGTFTTTSAVATSSLWSSTTIPAVPDAAPDSNVNLGTRFRSDSDGLITGIRFYKAAANAGPHTGYLFTATGTLLASVSFDNETASGWQQATFANPVAISAGTFYIVSYYCPNGHYAADHDYFNTDFDSAPLHAPASSDSAGNGVFAYGAPGTFPGESFRASNYYVDVMLAPGAQITPLSVVSVTPENGASSVPVSTVLTASFNKPLDQHTITSSTFLLKDSGNNTVPAGVLWDSANNVARLQALVPLSYDMNYTAVLKGGSSSPGILDLSGRPLESDYSWTFSTTVAVAPPSGRAAPILLLTTATNPFSYYYAEILRNEGFTEFATADITQLSAALLTNFDLVILPQTSLSAGQVSTLQTWVSGGGNLIAMRPDKQLVEMLGLTDAAGTLSDAYLAVNTASGVAAGITAGSMQFHDTADLYTLNGATPVATLWSDAETPLSNPAAGMVRYGSGQAAFFSFDLARSVVFTRQGNPAWSGQERDGVSPIRSDDLYFGGATSPDYVDVNKVAIPQADEEQRLLANLILNINLRSRPLPRFWYLPHGFKAAVIMTGDDHGNGGTVGRWNEYIAASAANCSVDNWECVRSTSYVYPNTPITVSQAQEYTSLGFELALHPQTGCNDFTPDSLEQVLSSQLSGFASSWPETPSPQTSRTHCIVWSDYDTVPTLEREHGIRLDTNYYYWPGSWIQDRPGFMTGSGMPMRFASRSGALLDIYQAATQMTDESDQTFPYTINSLLDNALGPLGYYGVFTANMHNDSIDSPGADAILASAKTRGVPIVSAKQMLTWLDGRNNSVISAVTWDGSTLGFHLQTAPGANGLNILVPAEVASGAVKQVTLNGSVIPFTTGLVKGINYAILNGADGTYEALYQGAPSLPVLTVTARETSKSYGDTNPPFFYDITGYVNNDPPSVVSGQAECSSPALPDTPAGTVPITCTLGSLAADNYNFNFAPGSLMIQKAPLAVTSIDVSRPYGDPNPALGGTITGLKNDDNITAAYATTATAATPVGTYPIVPSLADPMAKLSNYTVTSVNGRLTIVKAPLLVSSNNASRVYGDPNPAFTGTIAGQKNGDIFAASFSSVAGLTSAVGTYPITSSVQDPVGKLENYDVTPTNGVLTISPAALNVTAADASRPYGSANPVLTGSISGIRNSDNITVAYSTAATPGSPVGTYPIVASLIDPNFKLGNYAVTSSAGTLIVTRATPAITLTANPGASSAMLIAVVQTAGPTLPTGTVQFSEGGNSLGGPVSLISTSPGTAAQASLHAALPPGTHVINASYSGDTTYTAVSADAVTVVISAGEPAFSFSSEGGNTSASVQAGQNATYNIFLSSQGSSGTVQFSCAGAPAGTVCTVSPNSASLTANATLPITVTVSGTANARSLPAPFRGTMLLGFAVIVMGVTFGVRRKQNAALALMALLLIMGITACGGDSAPLVPRVPQKPPTTATLVVTAVSGSQTASINLSLIINH